MKTNILKLTVILLILAGSFCSCTKDKTLELGLYEEISPVKGRTRINFIDDERLVMLKRDYDGEFTDEFSDEFRYEISGKTISLLHIYHLDNPSLADIKCFHIINSSNFEICNFYPTAPPEASKSTIIFKKL